MRAELVSEVPTIRGDPDQLRQVLINLILNASDASPHGGEILVRVQRVVPASGGVGSSGEVTIDVVDHGVGMSQVTIDRIGTPFFTTKPDGTGLGLAICRQIVRDHGGTVQIQSRLGDGTTVTLAFPCGAQLPLEAEG